MIVTVARWLNDGTMIPGTAETSTLAPFTLSNAAVRGKYTADDPNRKTFEFPPQECRECGTIENVTHGWCAPCYCGSKL